jgi:N-acetyltransferase
MTTLDPVTLEGRVVRLIPLLESHLDSLCSFGLDPSIWTWTYSRVRDRAGMEAFVREALDWQQAGTGLPFTIVLRKTGEFIGGTRFMNVELAHRRVEIGGSWIAPAWQRSAVNTEAKYLLLRHAFETLGCMRVEFKTDVRNERSRAALQRLGAKEEGIFRKHLVLEDGRLRDSAWYSVIDDEWPEVKATLQAKLVP